MFNIGMHISLGLNTLESGPTVKECFIGIDNFSPQLCFQIVR